MKKLLALRWWLCVVLGIFVGAWLAADIEPIACPTEKVDCPDSRCRSVGETNDCYGERCLHGWVQRGEIFL